MALKHWLSSTVELVRRSRGRRIRTRQSRRRWYSKSDIRLIVPRTSEGLEDRCLLSTGATGGGQSFDNMQASLAVNYIINVSGTFPSQSGAGDTFLGEVRQFGGNFAPGGWEFADGQDLPIAQYSALFSLLGTTYGGNGETHFGLPDLRGRAAIHEGPGFALGTTTGASEVTLTEAQLPSHNHTISGGTTGSTGGGQSFDNMQPSQAVNYIVNISSGTFPTSGGTGNTFLGEVRQFAGNFAPGGWAFADGQDLPIASYSALFSLLGTTYGGNGETHFALPDLRGRAAIHEGPGIGLGAAVGANEVTLTQNQLPAHNHPITGGTTGTTGGGQSFDNMQSSLAVNYIVNVSGGVFPSPSGAGDMFLGEIRQFAGNFAPGGWEFADGQDLSIGPNSALFSLFGTTYGGNGSTHFGLPDMRGRIPVHEGPGFALGAAIGNNSRTLTTTQVPSHTHSLPSDTTAPTVTSVLRQTPTTSPTNADQVTFRVAFDEDVQNVDAADFMLGGTAAGDGTIGAPTAVTGTSVYDVTVTGLTSSEGTISLSFSGGQNIEDLAGNALSNTTPGSAESFTIDNTAPTLAIGAPSTTDTASGPVNYMVTYSDADTISLTSGQVTLETTGTANGSIAVSGSGTTRTVTISGITGDGTIGISIDAATASDDAGNASAAAGPSATFNVDNSQPAPSTPVLDTGSDSGPSNTDRITKILTPVFNGTAEAGSTVTLISHVGGTIGTATATGGNWSITASTLANGAHDITATSTDALGNVSAESSALSVTIDSAAPTPVIIGPSGPIAGDQFSVTIDFGQAVDGFDASEVTVGNGSVLGTLTDNGGGNFTATIDSAANGNVTVDVAASAAQDLAGNSSLVASQFLVNVRNQVDLSVSANAGTEAAGTAITVTATAQAAVDGDQTVDLAVTGTGITGDDYTLSNTQITIPDGQTTGFVTFTVTDDDLLELAETATLTMSGPTSGLTLGSNLSENIAITDNDTATADLSGTDGDESLAVDIVYTVTLTKSNATGAAITFDLADLLTGTATSVVDYTAIPGGTKISVPDGSDTGSFSVPVVDDGVDEGIETVIAQISNSSNPGVTIGTDTATANIHEPIRVNLSSNLTGGTEGAAGPIVLTASTASPVIGDQTVSLSVSGTDITSGDYTLPASITIMDGQTSGTATFTILNDTLIERLETATVSISGVSSGLSLGTTTSQNIDITNNDRGTVSIANISQVEGTSGTPTAFIFDVILSGAVESPISLTASTIDGTATAGMDYTAISNVAVSFAPEVLLAQVSVDVTADSDTEGFETFDLVLDNLSAAGLPVTFVGGATTETATATITNDDLPATTTQTLADETSVPGFAKSSGWVSVINKPGVENGDFLYSQAGQGENIAIWSFSIVPGQYRVSSSYRSHTNRATDAPFTLYGNGSPLTTVLVDQQATPTDLVENGVNFKDLAPSINLVGDRLDVILTNDADGLVIADAIRIERLGAVVAGPEIEVTVDDVVVDDDTGVVNFGDVEQDESPVRTFKVTNFGTTSLTLTEPISVPSGFTLVSSFGSTSLAPLESTTFQIAPDTSSLGLQTGQISFGNNDVGDDENPFNFTLNANIVPDTGIEIIDNGASGYSTTGSWTSILGNNKGHLDDFEYANGGTGANVATWTFSVTPGQYEVAASWRSHTNRSTAAPFTIANGGFDILTTTVDQTVPSGGIDDAGTSFTGLGVYNISSSTLTVRLSDNASGLVVADAVRIERIGDIPTGPEIVVLHNSSNVADGTGAVDFGDVETGDVAVETFTIFNFGTQNLTLNNPITTSPGFTATNFGATALAPNASTTFDLQMDTSVITPLSGTVAFTNNDADEGAFDFAVSGNVTPVSTVQVLDDDDAEFSTTGVWTHRFTVNGHEDDFHWAFGDSTETATARWTFDISGSGTGQYRVSVHWRAWTNRASDAMFSLNDDATSSAMVNQLVAPNVGAGVEENGTIFEDLGTFTFSGPTLEVNLSNLTADLGSIVVADAIRIERVGP